MKKLKDILSEQNASKINKKLSKLDKKISEQDRLGSGGRFELQTKAMGGLGIDLKPTTRKAGTSKLKSVVPIKKEDIPNKQEASELYKFLNGIDASNNETENYLKFIQKYQSEPNKSKDQYKNDPNYRSAGLFDKACVRGDVKCASDGSMYIPIYDQSALDPIFAVATPFVKLVQKEASIIYKYRHELALVGGIVGAFSGYTEVAMAIGFIDALMYKADGDKYMAGLCIVIEMVPFIGKPIGYGIRWTVKESKVLIAKLTGRQSGKLTAKELKIINHAAENSGRYSKPILQTMEASLKSGKASKVASTSARKKILAKLGQFSATKAGQIAIKLTEYATVIEFYDALAESKGWKRHGIEFKDVKSWFLSDGSTKDNLLLGKCLESGWEPGEDVPPKYQTESYKQDIASIQRISTDQALQELDEFRFENYTTYKLKDLLISSSSKSNKKSINEFLGTVIGIFVVAGIVQVTSIVRLVKWARKANSQGVFDKYGSRGKKLILKLLDKITNGQVTAETKIAGKPVSEYIPRVGGFRDAYERSIAKESTSAEVEAAYRSGRGVVASNAKGMQKSVKDYWLDKKLENPIYAGQRNHPDLVKEWESIVDTRLFGREWNFASSGTDKIANDELSILQDLWKRETNPVLNWYTNYRNPNKYTHINTFHTNESLSKYLIEKENTNILDFMHKNFHRGRDDFESLLNPNKYRNIKIFDSDAKGSYRWQAAQGQP